MGWKRKGGYFSFLHGIECLRKDKLKERLGKEEKREREGEVDRKSEKEESISWIQDIHCMLILFLWVR